AEPQFLPGARPMSIVLSAVPGFQELMEVQRTLSSLAATAGASVVAFKNGEASLEVALHGALTAREIIDGLGGTIGQHLLIEEARPDELRLRLRFVD
ncbi:MAG: hypothetical protein U1B78_04910, partial [Dehalococcoidia bacterium]|nr:hypothetical protein [Dehalococcoidia bacterium]